MLYTIELGDLLETFTLHNQQSALSLSLFEFENSEISVSHYDRGWVTTHIDIQKHTRQCVHYPNGTWKSYILCDLETKGRGGWGEIKRKERWCKRDWPPWSDLGSIIPYLVPFPNATFRIRKKGHLKDWKVLLSLHYTIEIFRDPTIKVNVHNSLWSYQMSYYAYLCVRPEERKSQLLAPCCLDCCVGTYVQS